MWYRHPSKGSYADHKEALRKAALATNLKWNLPDTHQLLGLARLLETLARSDSAHEYVRDVPAADDRVWSDETSGHSMAEALRFTSPQPMVVPTSMGEHHSFWFVRGQ